MANAKRPTRVLYAEASDLVQASHGPALEKLNCSVAQVASAAAAVRALQSEGPFDLILVGDLSKVENDDAPEPELSVITKARQQNPRIPILIFTSHNYLEKAYQAGATAHILKPAGAIALMDFIRPYLFSVSASEEPREKDSGGK